MRWAWLLVWLGCAPSDQLVVWVSPERLTMDVPGAVADDVERVQLLAGWEDWRAHGEWQLVSGWKQLRFGLDPGRYSYVLAVGAELVPDEMVAESEFVADPLGQSADPYSTEVSVVTLPRVKPVPATPPDGLIYQIMIDRFRNSAGALAPPASPGDRAGGTLDGVRAAIEAGYFAKLGVTTLWLSPVYQNPDGRHVGRDGHLYEAYHGYWPSQPRSVEPKLGGESALEALVSSAHSHGLRVVADAVPNHVYESHPYFVAHARSPSMSDPARQSWFNDGPDACVCGDPGCDWGAHIERCWFGPELPDLNWRNPQVAQAGAEDLAWWMQRFHFDGLRLDAVPMMPRAASRDIARAVRRQQSGTLILGEDYTGPGDEGRAEIRAYLDQSLDGLDSAFDFPLMWAARQTIAHAAPAFGFDTLEAEVAAGDLAWQGSGAVMAHMLGNHDTTRFASESAGDAGGDPWLSPPPQSSDASIYARQLIGLAFVLSLPGLPVIYYGDELALAGAGDPDSRRVLPDVLQPLPPLQQDLLDKVARLGRARGCLDGERSALYADADHDVSLRGAGVFVLSRSPQAASLAVPGLPQGRYRDVVSGAEVALDGPLAVAPLTAALWLPADDACWARLQ